MRREKKKNGEMGVFKGEERKEEKERT